MAYKILPYSFRKAKELGVVIKPSTNLLKKIDVFNYNLVAYSALSRNKIEPKIFHK